MGVLNHLLVAHPSEAEAIAASDEPSQTWDGFFCRGLDQIKIGHPLGFGRDRFSG